MTITAIDVTAIEPLAHDEAMRRQAQELDRTLALLRSLDDPAWRAPTDCPAWDIRTMYQHVLGACEAGASIRENIHQLRRARSYRKQHGGPLEAALSAVQVRERASLSPGQIIGRLTAIAPKTVRGRARTPRSCATTPNSRSTDRCTKPGNSATSSTPSTCATYGCTAPTPPARSASQSNSAPTTTAASSQTSSLNGRAATASPSRSLSPAQPAEPTPTTRTTPRPSTYRSTPSTTAAPSQAADTRPACSPPSSRSDNQTANGAHKLRASPLVTLSLTNYGL